MKKFQTPLWSPIECNDHSYIGLLPCPWPNCKKGIAEDTFEAEFPGVATSDGTIYRRQQWNPPEGEPYYTWIDAKGLPAGLGMGCVTDQQALDKGFRKQLAKDDLIYHYTGVEGLKAILDSQEMWLTDYAYLNDSAELQHGLQVFEEKLKLKLENSKYQAIADIFRIWLENIRTHSYRICITSYSLDGDSLSQWRAYGSIAIGIEPSYVVAGSECKFNTVIYDRAQQEYLVEFFLNHALQAFEVDMKNGQQRGNLDVVDVYRSGVNQVIGTAALFKNEGFRDEREVRVAYIEDPDLYSNLGIDRAPKRFRANKHGIIPYVTTRDITKSKNMPNLPIREIITGPTISEIGRKSISEYLEHQGLKGVVVRPSKVPFRS